MRNGSKLMGLVLAATLAGAGALAAAEGEHDRGVPERPEAGHGSPAHPMVRPGEPHPGPTGYQRAAEPPGWNARPQTFDRAQYQHNFQAAHTYRIGPYPRPRGWTSHRWVYGETLPRGYWVAQYILADYWLFGLEIPPVGFEWVRVGSDALLIDTRSGQILQVEYGVFY